MAPGVQHWQSALRIEVIPDMSIRLPHVNDAQSGRLLKSPSSLHRSRYTRIKAAARDLQVE